MSTNGIAQMPPIDFPSVKIGNETLTLKMSILAAFLLDTWGIAPESVGPMLTNFTGPGRYSLMWKLFAAMVAHNYVDKNLPYPSPEQWLLKLKSADVQPIFTKIIDALGKAQPSDAPSQTVTADSPAPLQ